MRLRILMAGAAAAALVSGGTVLAASHIPVSSAPTHAPTFASTEAPTATITGSHPRLVSQRLRAMVVSDAAHVLAMTPQALRQDLLRNESLVTVASAHNISSATLASDLQATLKTSLNARTASGKLSASRAQRLESIFGKHIDAWIQKPGKFWIHTERQWRLVSLSAQAMKMPRATLLADLKNHQSIADVAEKQGMSEASLQSAIESQVQERLLKAVQSGKIASAQEQQRLQSFDAHISQRLTRIWGVKKSSSTT